MLSVCTREKEISGADKQAREMRAENGMQEDGNSGYQEDGQGRVMKEGRRTMRGARARHGETRERER